MKRRTFMGKLAGSALAVAAGNGGANESAQDESSTPLPKRPLGDSGVELSVIGFSGLVARDNTPEGVDRVVAHSLERGVNFFDVAASYGNSEEMLAPAIRPHRKNILLSSKTRLRTREGAAEEFNRSCEIMETDYFDLYLVHGIQHVDRDVDAAFASGGAMEFLLEQQRSGRIRLLGFSAHSTESALAAMDRHDFDFFYFPISYAPCLKNEFGPLVLKKAREKKIPCISLKSLARQRWPEGTPASDKCAKCWYQPIEDEMEASLAMRWALDQQVTSLLPPGEERLYRKALALSGNLTPLTEAENHRLQTLAQEMTPLFPR